MSSGAGGAVGAASFGCSVVGGPSLGFDSVSEAPTGFAGFFAGSFTEKGAVDRDSQGRSLGSTAVREAVLRLHPRLVVCGHIHASGGTHEMLGTSAVINAGPEGLDWVVDAAG